MLYLSIPFILFSGIISGVVLRGFLKEAFSIFFSGLNASGMDFSGLIFFHKFSVLVSHTGSLKEGFF